MINFIANWGGSQTVSTFQISYRTNGQLEYEGFRNIPYPHGHNDTTDVVKSRMNVR